MGLIMGILSLFGKFRNRMLGDFVNFCGGRFLKYFLFVYGGILSFPKGRGVPRPGAGCLRRVTFVNSDKSNQKRHSRGKGFRFPFPLENPLSLKRPKREGCGPPSLETPTSGLGDYQIAPLPRSGKGGGGQRPPFRKCSCHGCTALHFRAKAAAKRDAETMQHLGEVCAAYRSRGKRYRNLCCVKARKGFSNRRFERRFWVLLPPRAKVPRAGARNVPLV